MKIYIPSKGRAGAVNTHTALIEAGFAPVLVVYKNEAALYRQHHAEVLVVPPSVDNIGTKRHWIVTQHAKRGDDPRLIMFDDDLDFAIRRKDDPTKFTKAKPSDVKRMTEHLFKLLLTYAHAGVLPREGANRIVGQEVVYNTRMQRVLAIRADVFVQHKLDYRRVPFIEDFDVILQLLRLGYSNVVLAEYCQNQGGSNAPGGCSLTRTIEKQGQMAALLNSYHQEFVKLVEKTTKTAWGGTTRTDVQVAWKKAYQSAGVIRKPEKL